MAPEEIQTANGILWIFIITKEKNEKENSMRICDEMLYVSFALFMEKTQKHSETKEWTLIEWESKKNEKKHGKHNMIVLVLENSIYSV